MMQGKWLATTAIAMALVATGCDDDDPGPVAPPPAAETFSVTLNGANERPNPVTTPGQGTATFTISADKNTLSWTSTITGTNNVFGSHIHIGGTNVAGPIAFGLFSGPTANNPAISGSVTRAAFASASVLGITFDGLLSLMRGGDTYMNVHTDDGLPPSNTGPGDFPGGEIRGQIIKNP
ncbi:MAG: CHRD domain-containing protein [Gemmatimonadaceae bacterium]